MRSLRAITRLRTAVSRLTWARAARCDILQFGGSQLTGLKLLADEYVIRCLPLVGESVNVWILLESVIRGRWNRFGYYATYVSRCKAKIILVWHDTNLEAFQISDHIDQPVVCIQNGMRMNLAPAGSRGLLTLMRELRELNRSKVDAYFVINESEKNRLSQFVEADFFVHGSLRSNHFASSTKPVRRLRQRKRCGYISSFPNYSDVPSGTILGNQHPFVSVDGQVLSYHDYYAYEAVVARAASLVCSEKNVEFGIISKRPSDDPLAESFFRAEVSPDVQVFGHPKGEGYSAAYDFDYLVTVDSTLGFEMLGLGRPVAFLANRLSFLGLDTQFSRLSFLSELPIDGPFWSSAITEQQVCSFLSRWLDEQVSTDIQDSRSFDSRMISVDPGNSKLRSYIRKCVNKST